ncbi:hypothetical protein SNA_13670 [Streptomyces natalensis ATCC 27448]|uniref:Uncharacterized protein n=1 Tax=Streptomyces natalensis ATCC 27448 TaxID=1240678 RepID=A0A0D7CMW0_9ACTN|nr:hypothetical protein SNA_13670 [Streptomyces natalensis ATCC 27448]
MTPDAKRTEQTDSAGGRWRLGGLRGTGHPRHRLITLITGGGVTLLAGAGPMPQAWQRIVAR